MPVDQVVLYTVPWKFAWIFGKVWRDGHSFASSKQQQQSTRLSAKKLLTQQQRSKRKQIGGHWGREQERCQSVYVERAHILALSLSAEQPLGIPKNWPFIRFDGHLFVGCRVRSLRSFRSLFHIRLLEFSI